MPAPTVLVLASGRGERFRAAGGGIHKLHAPLGPRTVVVPSVEGRRGHPAGFAAACGAAHGSGLPWFHWKPHSESRRR